VEQALEEDMPLVFVHGVTTRSGPDYDKEVLIRNALFRHFALTALAPDPADVQIFNTYWGDEGAKFLWHHASLPKDAGLEAFGPADETAALILSTFFGNQPPERDTMLVQIARNSMDDVVDLLWLVSSFLVEDGTNEAEKADALATLAASTKRYILENPRPLWLATVYNDQQFLSRLIYEVNEWMESKHHQTFADPFWELLRGARVELVNRVTGIRQQAERILSVFSRATLHQRLALFLGDVFVYLHQGSTPDQPGGIVSSVLADLDCARARQQESEHDKNLVVVAHSMGGNIMYDILTHYRPNLHVDVFVTVGSQIAVFEELKLFGASDQTIPNPKQPRVSKPSNVDHWLNVFDLNDFLGFATEGVFVDSKDFAFLTGGGLIAAHSKYFTLPSFHQRLEARLREISL